jgi:hypothetical protein
LCLFSKRIGGHAKYHSHAAEYQQGRDRSQGDRQAAGHLLDSAERKRRAEYPELPEGADDRDPASGGFI